MTLEHEFLLPAGAHIYRHGLPFALERGGVLPELHIAYHTYGQLDAGRSNAVWICHALTANSDAADWWPGLIGPGLAIDTERYFVVCANVLGSYYGSSSPRFANPDTGAPYGLGFPLFTVRDTVRAHALLAAHLGLNGMELVMGGSFGGHQVLEMALEPSLPPIRQLLALCTSARETAWSIAIHEAQRMAMEADPAFFDNRAGSPNAGIRAARAIGLLTYRTVSSYIERQTDEDERLDEFKAASYVRHQGQKLDRRFHVHCYWYLSKCLDSHHLGRGRGGCAQALSRIRIPTTIVGIPQDMLVPFAEQEFLAKHIPGARLVEMPSELGHDGFLTEIEQLTNIVQKTLRD